MKLPPALILAQQGKKIKPNKQDYVQALLNWRIGYLAITTWTQSQTPKTSTKSPQGEIQRRR